MNGFEVIEDNGIRFAEVIRSTLNLPKTRFFSPENSSMQFGIVAHEAGYIEDVHTHKRIDRVISDLQQMVVVMEGAVKFSFFRNDGSLYHSTILRSGDAILLVDGYHSIEIVEKAKCFSVKQGPFYGDKNDKILLQEK
jgi:hypothetical protein